MPAASITSYFLPPNSYFLLPVRPHDRALRLVRECAFDVGVDPGSEFLHAFGAGAHRLAAPALDGGAVSLTEGDVFDQRVDDCGKELVGLFEVELEAHLLPLRRDVAAALADAAGHLLVHESAQRPVHRDRQITHLDGADG